MKNLDYEFEVANEEDGGCLSKCMGRTVMGRYGGLRDGRIADLWNCKDGSSGTNDLLSKAALGLRICRVCDCFICLRVAIFDS